VAIKVLHPDSENFPELVARFEREAVAGAHIDHPNVASASDFGKFDEGSRFLVLELIRGITLRDLIEKGPVPYVRAAAIVSQAAAALGAAHDKGIIHRDVKPRNIMLHEGEGGRDVVKLIDFGLAKVPVEELSTVARDADDPRRSITQAGIVMGTVAYLAPEAALGMRAVRVPADLYSLGVVFYELLTGKHPFEADKPMELFAHHRNTPPPPLGVRLPGLSVPPALEAVVMRLLAKEPDERFADTKALIEAIDAALDRGRVSPVPSSERTPLPSASTPPPRLGSPFERRSRSVAWFAGIGGAAIAIAAAAFVVGRAGSTPAPAEASSAPAAVSQAPVDASSSRPVATSAREQLRVANESNDPKRAAAAISDLATRDPAAFRDRAVQTETALLAELVVGGDRQDADAVFSILESKLGADGLDVLYDLVSREAKAADPLERGGLVKPSGASARARTILAKPDVIARASPAMRVALEIRSSQCQRRKFLFSRAGKEGDDRALSILSAMQPPTCGPQGGGCCAKHPELDRAIADIQARLRR
ncbi:MAG: serine/threonine protein kinase, partial [Polyangiaceae bacterium]|nr:serine/threonine protein kinase [Polyangiaceae bacterium]